MKLSRVLEIITDSEYKSDCYLINFDDGRTLQIDPDFVTAAEDGGELTRIEFDNTVELDDWDNCISDGKYILTVAQEWSITSISYEGGCIRG